jgi:L-amino acid N-acyltransferase YncA
MKMSRTMETVIQTMSQEDWPAVQAIYREGIATGNATFETETPGWEEWNQGHLTDCRLVAKEDGQVVGWAALSPVSSRCAYRGVAEVSVYVSSSRSGGGIGRSLLLALIGESERAGLWTLQAGIFPENKASLALVKSCGFREIGRMSRIGCLNGSWRDVVLVERRSGSVGG